MKYSMNKLTVMIKALTLTSLVAAGVGAYGDDTEVFYSVNVSKPNLLFVLDVSGSMSGDLTGSGVATTVNKTVSHDSADSQQSITVTTTTSGGNGNNGNGNGNGGGNQTVTTITTGSNVLNDNSIVIGDGSIARFRFKDLGIPEDSSITNAYIQFEAGVPGNIIENNDEAKYYIYVQDTSDAPLVETNGLDVNGVVDWSPLGGWILGDRGDAQKTPDIKDLIGSIVSKGAWDDGNNGLAIYISAIDLDDPSEPVEPGKRWINSYDNVSDNNIGTAPTLHVEYASGDKSKIAVMKESLRVVLEDAPDNVKVGLMNYGQESDSSSGSENKRHYSVSGVAFPVTDINGKARDVIPTEDDVYNLPYYPSETITIREYIADIADEWNPTSYTPIVDSLYEAALYMRGEKMHYGQTLPTKNGAHPSTYAGTVVSTDMEVDGRDPSTVPTYTSPIESSCQENYIVLMTDGAPTFNISGDNLDIEDTKGPLARIRGSAPGPQGTLAAALPSSCATPAGVGNAGTCGAELTNYLATNDNIPDATSTFPNGQEGDQFIKTFTIGFGTGAGTNTEDYLKSLATYDDGNANTDDDGYFEASTAEALSTAFADILTSVSAPKGTLASPGYSVNVKSGLEHEKDIYIPVFDRKNASRWAGNLKKFKIVDDAGKRKIRGSNDNDAVDELGGFTNNALDYWSNSPETDPDGKVVQAGGLANLLDPSIRNIVSDIVSNDLSSNNGNKLVDNNNFLTNDKLGLPATATLEYRKKVINFMRGWTNGDATSTARYHMGDMLHSEPLVVTYNSGDENGNGKLQYIFAGTNEGYLHAFDTSDTGTNAGKEMFAFIPSELLSTIAEHQYLNSGNQQDHKYGVDGALTYRFIDKDGDGVVDIADDKVILYFGLRRGGSSYYALDVTKIEQPKLLWKVTKSNNILNPLNKLGQSWSAPYLARVGVDSATSKCKLSSTVEKTHCKEVMIVTGGYDADDDRNIAGTLAVNDATSSVTADVGNDVFIFDANDGTLIWSLPAAEKLKLNHSIPGGVRILDTNSNKLIDRMYFGDTGGNLWRLDLSESIKTIDTESSLNKLADLASSGNQSRKFYNEPDVSTMKLNGKTKFLVSIGSGYRAHPLDKSIQDKFFMVIDNSPYDPLVTTGNNPFTSTLKSQLATITVSANSVSQTGTIKDGKGWMVNLANTGEKVLATSVTVDGVVLFTTLVPEILATGVGIDQCAAPATQGRLYALDVLSGGVANAPLGFDTSNGTGGGTGINDGGGGTFTTVSKGEIPGKPQAIFNTLEVNDVTGSCTHPVDVRIGKKLSQATGYEACRLESVYWGDPEI